jgi:hypothetical protein
MLIQRETAQPADPLATLESDYAHAVLHLAWDRHKQRDELTLLFGFVELLPLEVPPPIDEWIELPKGSFPSIELKKGEHCVCTCVMPSCRLDGGWHGISTAGAGWRCCPSTMGRSRIPATSARDSYGWSSWERSHRGRA